MFRINHKEDWDFLDGDILLTFVKKEDGYVMDDHISCMFPMFENEYDEPGEGFLTYFGGMTKTQLINHLRNSGFTVYDEPFEMR